MCFVLRGSCCCGRAVELLLLLRDEERKLKRNIYGSMERVGWDGIISSVRSSLVLGFLGV